MKRSVVATLGVLLFAGCVDDACSEITCGDRSVVTFPPGLIEGPYDLVITGPATTLQARCLQPAAPEAAENSPELKCDASSFEVTVEPGLSVRELGVTIIDVDSEVTLVAAVTVPVDAVDEETPNGPDCPPICFVRNGALIVPDGG